MSREVDALVATKIMGWGCYVQDRGGYAHVGFYEREPWLQHRNPEQYRDCYAPMDPRELDAGHEGAPHDPQA